MTGLPEQEGRTVYVSILEHVTGKDLRYLCEKADEREKIVADDLGEEHRDAICSTIFRLAMEFINLCVLHGDLAPRPVCSTKRCLARHEVDVEDVQVVIVDFERVFFLDPNDQSLIDRYRKTPCGCHT